MGDKLRFDFFKKFKKQGDKYFFSYVRNYSTRSLYSRQFTLPKCNNSTIVHIYERQINDEYIDRTGDKQTATQ